MLFSAVFLFLILLFALFIVLSQLDEARKSAAFAGEQAARWQQENAQFAAQLHAEKEGAASLRDLYGDLSNRNLELCRELKSSKPERDEHGRFVKKAD